MQMVRAPNVENASQRAIVVSLSHSRPSQPLYLHGCAFALAVHGV